MRIRVTTVFDAPVEWVWEMAQKPATLQHISWPLLTFTPVGTDQFPERWDAGPQQVRLRMLGIIPAGKQWINGSMSEHPSNTGDGQYWLRDNGSGDVAQTWDHWLRMKPVGEGQTAYQDDVRVKAGVLTPFIGLFAYGFYKYRQWRWRRMIARERPGYTQ